jgi:hypothetical protein
MAAGPAPAPNGSIDHGTRRADVNTPAHFGFELRFTSLFQEGRGYAFPCDAQGHVDLDSLSERARANYFFARSVIGREVTMPAVLPSPLH